MESSAVALGLLALSSIALASDESSGVTVAGEPVPKSAVVAALDSCATHAADLELDVCLRSYFVPRWLLDQEAATRSLGETPAMKARQATLLAEALMERIAEETKEPSATEISEYLKANERDFEKPLRIRVFRILFERREEAEDLIVELTPETTVEEFRKWARELSVDQATNERAGDLGFLWPDGSTDVPQVSAEKSLYEAALPLKDGEFSKVPVEEAGRFAVVWRRGSLPPIEPDEASRDLARGALRERAADQAIASLLQKLAPRVTKKNTDLLGKLRRKEATLFDEP